VGGTREVAMEDAEGGRLKSRYCRDILRFTVEEGGGNNDGRLELWWRMPMHRIGVEGTCSPSHRGNGCVVWWMEAALAQGEQECATTVRLKFTVLLLVDIGAS
jgi:hypothetical protein